MIRVGICKIFMIGDPCLIIGIGRDFLDGDTHWYKFQHFTLETYLDSNDIGLREAAEKYKDYQGDTVYFESLGKSIPILQKVHDFSFLETELVEITLDEMKSLFDELRRTRWTNFDLETWGK